MGPWARPFRGYCLLSLPRRSSSGRATLSGTIPSTSASGSSKSCPTSSLRRHARRAASLPAVFPSLHPPTLGPEWWDPIFWVLLAVKLGLLVPIRIFTSCVGIMTFLSLSSLISLWVGCSCSAKNLGGDKAKDGRGMRPICRNQLSRDLSF